MTELGMCPKCQSKITADRVFANMVVCECGWTVSKGAQAANEKMDKKISLSILILAFVIVGSFVQAVNWDNHFFSIIPLKAKQWTGIASVADLNEISKICTERMKYDCVEDAYIQRYQKDPMNIENLPELGKLQLLKGDPAKSSATLKKYFDLGGTSLDAAYDFAKALGQSGQIEFAIQYYEMVLAAKPDVLQVTVTRSYVNMLVENNQLNQAKKIIKSVRRKGSNTGYFMDRELQAITQKIGKSGKS